MQLALPSSRPGIALPPPTGKGGGMTNHDGGTPVPPHVTPPDSSETAHQDTPQQHTPHQHGAGTGHAHAGADTADVLDAMNPSNAAEKWDELYSATAGRRWSGNANPQLVHEATGMTPGRALDLGCGEGGDALWLARNGWQVTAVDVSSVALARAAEHESTVLDELTGSISWEQRDLFTWQPSPEFDLVSAQFLHSTALPWQQALATAAAAVGPGGTLLIVGHHPDQLPPWGAHRVGHALFTATEVVSELGLESAAWQLDFSGDRQRTVTGPEGQDAVIADVVIRAVRLTA